MRIHVEEDALAELKQSLETAGEEYKSLLGRLTNLMEEITKGDIQGDLADDLLLKFKEKEEDFKSLTQSINRAEEQMGIKGRDFNNLVSELEEDTH